jgi:AraC family transcriptional regulator
VESSPDLAKRRENPHHDPDGPRRTGVARAARLSPYHFHRVFQVLVGETLAEFVKRLRLERALVVMARAPRSSLTTIALTCGFSSSSDFSRRFKQRYFGSGRAREGLDPRGRS